MNMQKTKLISVVLIGISLISVVILTLLLLDEDNRVLNSVAIDDDSVVVEAIEVMRHKITQLKGKTAQQKQQIEQRTAQAKLHSADLAYVLSLDHDEKIDFLNELLNILNVNKSKQTLDHKLFKDAKALSVVLAQLALDESDAVSYAALKLINLLAWASHTVGLNPNAPISDQLSSGLPDFRGSEAMKTSLTQLIGDALIDDEIKSFAIAAHSLLYPPDDVMISQFEQMISEGGLDQGDTLTAIFTAFTHYKRLYDYDMPASTLEVTKVLMDHPSDSVKSDVISQLRRSVGEPIVPVLMDQLRASRTSSVINHLVLNILMINPSVEVVQQLKEIAENTQGSGKKRTINYYTHPESIKKDRERYSARKAAELK